jgi:Domain of unknown function (DUF4113)
MRTVEALNGRFGRGMIGFGLTGKPRVWKLRSAMPGPHDMTEWEELLCVWTA